jgi:uncharacterized protein (TIGR02466 family)
MAKHLIFSDSIIVEYLVNDFLKKEILKYLQDCEEKKLNVIKSNQGGFQTPHIYNKEICNIFLKKCFTMLSKHYKVLNCQLNLESFWINKNMKNNFNTPHVHPGSNFSAVYYLQTSDEDGELNFFRNDKSIDFGPNQNLFNDSDFWNNFKLKPKDNMFVLFPSYLQHMVFPHNEDKSRISLSFNININKNG